MNKVANMTDALLANATKYQRLAALDYVAMRNCVEDGDEERAILLQRYLANLNERARVRLEIASILGGHNVK